MYRRPKSCSKHAFESRRVLKHQQSMDSCWNGALKIPPPKRTNSLQNLNEARYKERMLTQKPAVKLVWTEERPKTFKIWNGQSAKTASEESKRKSIDIFLARGFVEPVRVSPSNETGTRLNSLLNGFELPSSSKTLFERASGQANKSEFKNRNELFPNSNDESVDQDFSNCEPDVEINVDDNNFRGTEHCRNEKKVTFASEVFEKRKLTAEMRRQQFHNSHSKLNKTSSSIRLENQNSFNYPLIQRSIDSGHQLAKKVNSISTNENFEGELGDIGCVSPNLLRQSNQIDKQKQLCVKRKLKSCRSRSFHKSLDSSTVIENLNSYSFAKSSKPNPTEVVTMISLLTSKEHQDVEISLTGSSVVNVNEPESECYSLPNANDNKNSKVFFVRPKPHEIEIKSGILKMKPFMSKTLQLGNQTDSKSSMKLSTISSSEKSEMINSSNKFVENETDFYTPEQKCDRNSNSKGYSKNDTEKEDLSIDTIQFQKEKECWSSFRKMTNKGVTVSFDTILRGLLTPTEYRLRKTELLSQE